MHFLYLVLLEKDNELTSQSARKAAVDFLNNQGFADQDGPNSYGKADWYVIGGRWSGCLTKALGKKIEVDKWHRFAQREQYNKFRKDEKSVWHPSKMTQKMFESKVKEHMKYVTRNTYQEDGYEDDAMLLTPKLRKGLQKTYKPRDDLFRESVEVSDASPNGEEFPLEKLTKKHDGRWIVVIDYHS